MFDRVSMLIASGVIAAGVSAAMLAGAGVAIAATEPGADSQPSMSDTSGQNDVRTQPGQADTGTQDGNQDTDADESSDDPGTGDPTDAEADVADTEADVADTEADFADIEADVQVAESDAEESDAEEAGAEEADAPEPEADAPEPDADKVGALGESERPAADAAEQTNATLGGGDAAVEPSRPTDAITDPLDTTSAPVAEGADVSEPATEPEPAAGAEAAAGLPAETVAVASGSVTVSAAAAQTRTESAETTEPAPVVERLAMLSAADAPSAEAAAPRQTLLSIVGAIVFNLYSFAIRAVGGPPLLPWGSTVTVHSSKLEIDCGDGYEVPADWYVPEGPTPTQLIYLQHGFMAAGPFYSYTASRLAEATQSIVVATSLTSNFLACDGCWVGGSPMHKAVADLFGDGNTALVDSATAAGYGPSLLEGVEKVVLTGHSAGGGLAAGAAGYLADNNTMDRLAGVVMLDGVGFGQVVPEALAKLPDELPVYNLAGKAYFWNLNGSAGAALEKEWPDRFNGVRLIGGLHSDTMLGGNPLIQAGLNLVTGWSKIENVKAAEILGAAWINDMFAGNPTSPYYGAAGTMLEIETPRGIAEAYVMPGPPERLTVVDVLFQFFVDILFGLDFATCAAPSGGSFGLPAGQSAGTVIELPKLNTALSLDGSAKPGHSIDQHLHEGLSGIKDASQRPNRLQRGGRC